MIEHLHAAIAQRVYPIHAISEAVAKVCGVTVRDLRGPCRARWIIGPRQLAMTLVWRKNVGRYSSTATGEWFGGRDHTTVIHAAQATKQRLEQYPEWVQIAERVVEGLDNPQVLEPLFLWSPDLPQCDIPDRRPPEDDPHVSRERKKMRLSIKAELEACRALCDAFRVSP